MLLTPSAIVLYVNDLAITSKFYQNLLGIIPNEESPSFHSFKLSNGMDLALKTRQTVMPPADKENGNGELAFTLANTNQVDKLFSEWQAKKINIIFPPSAVPFGYTFVALDPDGYRLRVVSLGSK